MPAFTGGVSRTHKEFTPQPQGKPRRNDIFAFITGYDLSRAVINVKGDDDGRLMQVSIDPETVDRNNKTNATKNIVADWFGHLVDDKMSKHLKVGAKIIVEASSYSGKPMDANGEKVYPMRSTRIINVPNTEPEKAFKGLFSLDTRTVVEEGVSIQRVVSIQAWDEQAIAINDQAGLDSVRQRIEKSLSEYGKIYNLPNGDEMAAVVPTIGVQFRARAKNAEIDPVTSKEFLVVTDTSGCFDWIPAPRDEQNNVLPGAKGHPLDVENLNGWIQGYNDHINSTFGEEAKNLEVEVCVYRNFAASPKSGYIKLSTSEKAPLNILANSITRLSQDGSDEDNLAKGKNWIVSGIVQVSPNSIQKINGTLVEIPRNYVQRLHANGVMGHVHAWIRASNGGKCVPHEALKRVQKDKPADTPAPAPAPASASAGVGAGVNGSTSASVEQAKTNVASGSVSTGLPGAVSAVGSVGVANTNTNTATSSEDWNPFDVSPLDANSVASVRRAPGK